MPQKKKKGRFEKRELEQIEESYREIAGTPAAKPKKKRRPLLTVLLILLLICGLLGGGWFAYDHYYEGPPLIITSRTLLKPGVSLMGVQIGGMTKDAAIAAITQQLGDYSTQPMTVQVLEESIEISPAVSGAGVDAELIVTEAFNYGTTKHPGLEMDIENYLHLDENAIRTMIKELATHFPTEGAEASWQLTDKEIDGVKTQVLVVDMGTNYYDFDEDAVFDQVMDAYLQHEFSVEYTCNQLNDSTVDPDAIYAETCTEAVDAVLDVKTLEVTQSVAGSRFDLDGLKEALQTAQRGDTLEFPFVEVPPAMDTETLKSMLFRDKLGTFTAKAGSQGGRDTNLKLACQSLDGTILNPGDTFSYNACLGERTAAKGYKPAGSYVNGQTVQTYGGGICQPSSCLYYSVLLADLEIVERKCHGFVSSYMPLGMDATVDWNGPDFKFKNNTDFPIRIDATAKGGTVTVTLIGTDTKDYYVKMEYEVLSKTAPKTIYKEVKAGSGHKDGEVITTAYTGYTVQSYQCKYDKETDALITREKEAYSVYSKRDKVVYKVIQEAPPATTPPQTTPPEPTSPEPTTPPEPDSGRVDNPG